MKVLIGRNCSLGKDVHKQVERFHQTILNILNNFIPKLIVCNDKDLPWMSDEIKTLIKKKNWMHLKQRSRNLDYNMLNPITVDISNAVNSSKFTYHDRLTA